MLCLSTVLLEHVTATDRHYDWMIEDPASAPPDRALRTWRVQQASGDWSAQQTLQLQELGLHRRAYLTYEGPLSGDRGRVSRVDQGQAVIESWTSDAAIVAVRMKHFEGYLSLRRVAGSRWTATVLEDPPRDGMMR